MRGGLPGEVLSLIRSSVPTLDALEVLLRIVRAADQSWTAAALAERPHEAPLDVPTVASYLGELQAQGLVERAEADAYRFAPATPEVAEAVRGLVQAYDERPVTLIRSVYAIADSRRIQGLADAFLFRKPTERG